MKKKINSLNENREKYGHTMKHNKEKIHRMRTWQRSEYSELAVLDRNGLRAGGHPGLNESSIKKY